MAGRRESPTRPQALPSRCGVPLDAVEAQTVGSPVSDLRKIGRGADPFSARNAATSKERARRPPPRTVDDSLRAPSWESHAVSARVGCVGVVAPRVPAGRCGMHAPCQDPPPYELLCTVPP